MADPQKQKPNGETTAEPKKPSALEQVVARTAELAKSPQERAQAFEMASRFDRSVMTRKAIQAIAETGWGKEISPVSRAAVAQYCLECGIDAARHVFVLGGNIFINGTFYRDVIAANPDFDHADDPQWFHVDSRASEEEKAERLKLRVDHNIPEDCPAACLLILHYKHRGPFKGIGRVRAGLTANNKPKDPVGLEFPRESAETRAWREAGEKAEPVWFRKHPRLQRAEEVVVAAHEMERKAVEAGTAELGRPAVESDGGLTDGERKEPGVAVETVGREAK